MPASIARNNLPDAAENAQYQFWGGKQLPLDQLGEQVFVDGKVRKVLDAVLQNPPRALLNLVRSSAGIDDLKPNKLRDSIVRVWSSYTAAASVPTQTGDLVEQRVSAHRKQTALEKTSRRTARRRLPRGEGEYDEAHHLSGKPQEVVELYRAVDRLCLSMKPGEIVRRFHAKYIAYYLGKKTFCSIHAQRGGLRIWLQVKYSRLESPPVFARDVSEIGHWGAGDLELRISSIGQVDEAASLIRQSFDARVDAAMA